MTLSLPLVLASASPRRQQLLTQLVTSFSIEVADIEERRDEGESPEQYVARLAYQKAQAVAHRHSHHWVLGADTIVVLGARVFEKPVDQADCMAMLRCLSGQTHQVMTAIALVQGERVLQQTVTTDVRFRHLSDQELADYWQTGEPCDKAGGYGIQGLAGCFVESIQGSYSGVVGLPLCQTYQLLAIAAKGE